MCGSRDVFANDDAAGDIDVHRFMIRREESCAGGVAVQEAVRPSSEDGMAADRVSLARSGEDRREVDCGDGVE